MATLAFLAICVFKDRTGIRLETDNEEQQKQRLLYGHQKRIILSLDKKNPDHLNDLGFRILVPRVGLEPTRSLEQWILSPPRLPISPPREEHNAAL